MEFSYREAARFMRKIDRSGDCWRWLASKDRQGYGYAAVGHQTRKAHRAAYELLVGPIPFGLELDHLCRNTSCVNPAHLEPVTTRQNVLRGNGLAAANARKTHCKRGHEFTPENIKPSSCGRPGRSCLTCHRALNRKYRAQRMAAREGVIQ